MENRKTQNKYHRARERVCTYKTLQAATAAALTNREYSFKMLNKYFRAECYLFGLMNWHRWRRRSKTTTN